MEITRHLIYGTSYTIHASHICIFWLYFWSSRMIVNNLVLYPSKNGKKKTSKLLILLIPWGTACGLWIWHSKVQYRRRRPWPIILLYLPNAMVFTIYLHSTLFCSHKFKVAFKILFTWVINYNAPFYVSKCPLKKMYIIVYLYQHSFVWNLITVLKLFF